MPWLHEGPSDGIAIWDGTPATPLSDREELSLCVLRVDFVEDFTPLTTGDGRFDDGVQPPHDAEYTAELCTELSSWLYDVSGGAFELEFEVFPEDGAFHMPHQMSCYGADSAWARGSCLLLRDAVQGADGEVDFSRFQSVMVMHAGAGQEADILGDSPDDLHSVFLTLADLAYYLPEGGSGYPGISTNDGVFVREGIMVPEQESQDGYGLGVIGTIVHEFMHQLGLPDLYDTIGGGVGVGGWDIMGYGQWMSAGFWPTGPGAWCRVRLGWTDTVDASSGGTWDVSEGGDVLKVALSGSEYLLVENRLRDPDGDGLRDEHERDYALPGSGILIWHVDSGVLSGSIESNTVNTDPAHKGVDLEEADGIQDFDYSLPDVYGIMGSEYDPFFSGGYSDTFGPSTVPATETSWGGTTGVSVSTGSQPGPVMSVSVQPVSMAPGWPVRTGPVTAGPVIWESADGPRLLLLSTTGLLWKVDPSEPGEPVTAIALGVTCLPAAAPLEGGDDNLVWTGDDGEVHLLDPSGGEMPGWPVQVGGMPVRCALLRNADAVAVATDRNEVHLFDLGGDEKPGWPVGLSEITEAPTGLAAFDEAVPGAVLALSTAGGRIHSWNLEGEPLDGWSVEAPGGAPVSPPLLADIDRDGEVELTVLCGRTLSCFSPDGAAEAGFPVVLRSEPMGDPWLCDPDSDGFIDMAIETASGVVVYEASGFMLSDWPEMLDGDPSGLRSENSSGCGGSGFAAHFARDGRVFLRGALGDVLPGFPLSTGDGPVGIPILIDHDQDGDYGLAACDESGWIGLWDDVMTSGGWFPGLDFSGTHSWPSTLLPAASSGSGGISSGTFFVYPNPVRGDLGRIRFETGTDSDYSIRVFNIAGELVSSFDGECSAGLACEVEWDTSDLSPGLYFVCLSADGSEELFHAAVTGSE